MDILSWIFWLLRVVVSMVWSLAWLLLGGWVSTLAQILAILGIVAVYRYGWRRAPLEVWGQLTGFVRFAANWMRGRDLLAGRTAEPRKSQVVENIRIVRVKETGDVNLSTALSLIMLGGFCALAAAL
jgi:hypothetical protein